MEDKYFHQQVKNNMTDYLLAQYKNNNLKFQ